MEKQNWTVSEVLAHRDGELRDAQREQMMATDPQARQMLHQIARVRHNLKDLPDVAVDDEVWLASSTRPQRARLIDSRDGAIPARAASFLRYPVATAASVCIATTLLVVFLLGARDGFEGQISPQPIHADQTDPAQLRLASLMSRSRDLELGLSVGFGSVPAGELNPGHAAQSRAARQLLYRLADVDAEIARLYDDRVIDGESRERLWRQRVRLLENLMLVSASTSDRLL
jgi:hypothetical protein